MSAWKAPNKLFSFPLHVHTASRPFPHTIHRPAHYTQTRADSLPPPGWSARIAHSACTPFPDALAHTVRRRAPGPRRGAGIRRRPTLAASGTSGAWAQEPRSLGHRAGPDQPFPPRTVTAEALNTRLPSAPSPLSTAGLPEVGGPGTHRPPPLRPATDAGTGFRPRPLSGPSALCGFPGRVGGPRCGRGSVGGRAALPLGKSPATDRPLAQSCCALGAGQRPWGRDGAR